MGKALTEVSQEIMELAELCRSNSGIDPELYKVHDVKRGLRDLNGNGVVAGLTRISDIVSFRMENGEKIPCEGVLRYRGINIREICNGFLSEGRFGFEEVTYLLLFGQLPTEKELTEFKHLLNASRTLPTNFVRDVVMKAPSKDMMNTISRCVLTLACYDKKVDDISLPNVLRQCIMLIAVFPMLAVYGYCAYNHYGRGKSLYIHNPDPKLSTAENILRMLRPDKKYTELEAKILDMALVLIKAIFLSLLSVFTLMPGLLVLFCPLIDRTRHKKLLPNITVVGKFAVKTRKILPPLFLLSLIGAFYLSSNCPYAYSYNDLKTAKMSERQVAYFKIKEHFGTSNMVALLVPSGNYEAEANVLRELEARPEVKSTMGLSGMEAMEGYTLTDALTPRELSELIGMDYEVIQLLYSAYAAEHDQYGAILSGLEDYEIPLFDMVIYLKDTLESHNIELEMEGGMSVGEVFELLDMAQQQMKNERYSRMVVYLNLPEESEETFEFLSTIRGIMGKYYEGDYYVVGNSTSSRDLSASFATDNLMISLLSAFFVILVLLFTFQSAGLPVLLIIVIQGSIWINFSVPTITQTPLYFLGYLIVNAIQMGANIDYAIVISSHYQEMKEHLPHKEAIVHALNSAFPTVFTSGTMMASAGLLIGNMSAQPVVSIMGMCIGRGTIISIFLVLFVLPSILVLGDSVIERTSFKMKGVEMKPRKEVSGDVRVHGHIRGHISGFVDARIDGFIHGEMNAMMITDGEIEKQGGEEHA